MLPRPIGQTYRDLQVFHPEVARRIYNAENEAALESGKSRAEFERHTRQKKLEKMIIWSSRAKPRISEIVFGLCGFVIIVSLITVTIGFAAPAQPMHQGIIYSFAGGLAGIGGFFAAFGAGSRNMAGFGVRPARLRWLVAGICLGVIAFLIGQVIQSAFGGLLQKSGNHSQTILNATAGGDALPFLLSFFGASVFTPIGQELFFRGVIANALNRYGAWLGVGLSAVIFGVVNSIGLVLPVAIMLGLLTGILFRKTGSVWPCIILHGVYKSLHSVASAFTALP